MFQWHRLLEDERRTVLTAVSNATGYPSYVVEKDWWVVLALKAAFSTPWAGNLVFKGGTSLSKSWNLIERFSEDIDLAIDRTALGFPAAELSANQIKELRKKSAKFMEEKFMPAIVQSLVQLEIDPGTYSVEIDPIESSDVEPRIIKILYKSVVDTDSYIANQVLIEIGARSLREPCSQRPITSFISEQFHGQSFADEAFNIETVHPERTFLEKICLLHEEFSKPAERMKSERLSRHPYDLHRIMDDDRAKQAIADPALFNQIVAHRQKYNPVRGISYQHHTYTGIDFIPPTDVQAAWKADYNKMLEGGMIYGDPPGFDQLMERMAELRGRFRSWPN